MLVHSRSPGASGFAPPASREAVEPPGPGQKLGLPRLDSQATGEGQEQKETLLKCLAIARSAKPVLPKSPGLAA